MEKLKKYFVSFNEGTARFNESKRLAYRFAFEPDAELFTRIMNSCSNVDLYHYEKYDNIAYVIFVGPQ